MSKLRIKKARTDYSPFWPTPLTPEMIKDYIDKHGVEAYKEIAELIEGGTGLFNNEGDKFKRKIFKDLDVAYTLYEKNYEMVEKNKKYFPLKESKDKKDDQV